MDREQRIAQQNAQTTRALILAMGMQAENQFRAICNESPAYKEDAFAALAADLEPGNVRYFLVMD